MPENLEEYFDFITETAYLAGRLTLGYYQAGVRADMKKDDTPVTVADRLSEELIRGRIEKRYPGHTIVGEEFGVSQHKTATHRWFIDPIDGTKSFVHGVPLFAVLIGLEIEGQVKVGAAYFPALDEMLAAAIGLGCWWNGKRAHVSPVARLSEAVVTFTDPAIFERCGKGPAWERLQKACYYRPGWTDAYGYMLTATGRAELTVDPIMNVWDCGPFPPIFSEAGGFFGDWHGNPTIYANEAIATSQILLPEVLALIRG
jgi:myo-inositol-1(or 4)-monophosphatase